MVAIAFVAISIVGLRYANNFWTSCFTFLAFVLVLSSILGFVYSGGAHRAAWVGAAIFGGSYLMLLFVPWLRDSGITDQLPAVPIGLYLHQQLVNGQAPSLPPGSVANLYQQNGQMMVQTRDATGRVLSEGPLVGTLPDQSDLCQVLHAISAIVMMILGSMVALYFFRMREGKRAAVRQ